MRKYSRIIGTGHYLPERIMPNAEWEKRVETSDEWIVERTGIHSRHIAAPEETASSMAEQAARHALQKAGVAPEEIELVIVTTGTPDQIFPATACHLQKRLEIPQSIAFDVQAACSGFIYALGIADQFIQTGKVKRALVACSELMSRLVDWTDRSTCVLFGDGAGAVVLEGSSEPGILDTVLYADGKEGDSLTVNSIQQHAHALEKPYPYVQMAGKKVFKTAVQKLGELVEEMRKKHQLTAEHIDWLIPHQANIRIMQATAQKLHLPWEKVICTVDKHSNTSSASIPLALDLACRDGRVQPGQLVLLEAFGGGLTWGAALIRM